MVTGCWAQPWDGGFPGQQQGLPFRSETNPRIRLNCTHSPEKRKILGGGRTLNPAEGPSGGVTHILEQNARTRAAAQETRLVSPEKLGHGDPINYNRSSYDMVNKIVCFLETCNILH